MTLPAGPGDFQSVPSQWSFSSSGKLDMRTLLAQSSAMSVGDRRHTCDAIEYSSISGSRVK